MKNKVKLLFFIPHLVGGGAERVTLNIIELLDKNKYDISLVILNKNAPLYKLLPNDIKIYNLNIKKTIFSIFKLRKIIINTNPNIVFATHFRSHIALFSSILFLKKKPELILRYPNSPEIIFKNNELKYFTRIILNFIYKNSSKIIAQTPEMRNEIVKYHKIDKKKIIVYSNPINKNLILKNIENVSNPFNKRYINVVASGRITEQKGFDILIKAFKKVITIDNSFKLHIIGENINNEKKQLEIIVKTNNLEKYVFFLGFQENPYKFYYYSDLFVLSSRWEGFPNVLIENIYLNKPVVSTISTTFISKLIINNKNGILVPIEDIDKLAKAIINYKKIKPNRKVLDEYFINIDNIFIAKGYNNELN